MNSSSTDFNYCGFPSVPRASIRCSSRFSSRSSCSFTSCTYSNWLAEATAGVPKKLSLPLVELDIDPTGSDVSEGSEERFHLLKEEGVERNSWLLGF